MQALRFEQLTKRYGRKPAVQNLTFGVRVGTLCCLLGRNGAGKTTVIHTLMGLTQPTAGDIWIGGVSIRSRQIRHVRRSVGFLPEEARLYEHLTGREFLEFVAALYGPARAPTGRIEHGLDEVGMSGEADTLIRTYSMGMKRRIAVAAALLPDPEVLVFDEPTGSLDAVSTRTVRSIMERYRDRGRTVFFTTHSLEMAERIADRYAILHEGSLRFEGSLADLRCAFGRGPDDSLEDLFLRATGEGPAADVQFPLDTASPA